MELKLNPDYNDYSIRGNGFSRLRLKDFSQTELNKLYELGYTHLFLSAPLKSVKTTTTTINKDELNTNDTN